MAWAGVAPDLDALTVLFGREAYGQWHHLLCHGLPFALVVTLVCGLIAGRSVAALAFVAFHLHLVCDLLGSGREWPIAYLYPFSNAEIGLSWGWELASWQNVTIMIALLAAMAFTARRWGRTFAEGFLPPRLADEVAKTIARWF